MRRLATLAVATAMLVAGCGTSTSESAPSDPSSLQKETSVTSTAAADKDAASKDGKAKDAKDSASATDATSGSAEQGSHEVDSVPDGGPSDPKDKAFLDELKGVDTKGVEDQLIATAQDVCQQGSESVLLNAVAGQLVAQNRFKGEPDQLRTQISQAAQKAYC